MASALPYPIRTALLLALSAPFLSTAGHAQAAAPFANPYQPIPNFRPFNTATNSPTADDCTGNPQSFHNQPVVYVTPYDSSTLSHALQNLTVQPGQLVCVATGNYAPFTISTGGTGYNNMTSYEVMPGNTATIDLNQNGSSTAWGGITIAKSTWHPVGSGGYNTYAPLSYVVVSGFYVVGPDDAISTGQYGGWNAALNGSGSGFFSAGGISAVGNEWNSTQDFVPGSEVDHIYIVGNRIVGCAGGGIGTIFGDYIVVNSNIISDSAWFTSYGGSGISLLDSYDSHPSDDKSPGTTTGYNYKNYVINNTLYNNAEFIPWIGAPGGAQVTDGEGIIIDTNMNSDEDGTTFGGSTSTNGTYVPAYGGYTLVENNVVYSGGSAAIETVGAQNVDIVYNTTFNNDLNYGEGEEGKGEVYLYDSLNINVGDNILYTSIYDTPIAQVVDSYFIGVTPLNAKIGASEVQALAVPSVFQNLFYSYLGETNNWTSGYAPANGGWGVLNNGGDPGFISGAVTNDTQTNNGPVEEATPVASVNLNINPTASSAIQNGYDWLMLPTDVNGTSRGSGSYGIYSIGAYFIPF